MLADPGVARLLADGLGLVFWEVGKIEAALAGDFVRHSFGVTAEDDVGASTSHVGGDGDGAENAGLGDDGGLTLMLLGVEDVGFL